MRNVFCNPSTVTNLYLMDADGKNMRCLSAGPINETAPSVMDEISAKRCKPWVSDVVTERAALTSTPQTFRPRVITQSTSTWSLSR